MPRSMSYQEELIEFMKDPEEAAPYIEACLEEDDPAVLRLAIKDVVEAHRRMNKLSEKAKMLHKKFDLMLLEKKGEELYCLGALLDELGFHLAVTVKSGDQLEDKERSPSHPTTSNQPDAR